MKFILSLLLIFFSATSVVQAKKAQKNLLSSTQILTHEIEGGYSWTITTRLSYFLKKAQKAYGPRDKSWTILGSEFVEKGSPKIWYPSSAQKTKFIAIQLTKSAASDKKRALFQLAHETIHLLSPNGPGNEASVFEEGIAAYFSIHGLKGTGVKIDSGYIGADSYTKAYTLVSTLYGKYPDTDKRIKAFRAKGMTLSRITKGEFIKIFPKMGKKFAKLLTQRFSTLQ